MRAAQAPGGWPTTEEYDRALLNRAQTVYDPDIKNGVLLQDKTSPIHLGGGVVCAYKVDDWVVRCFTGNPPPDLAERYAAITTYIAEYTRQSGHPLDFVVPCVWTPQGIRVAGRDWPFVKVAFVRDGSPLGSVLSEHREDAQLMRGLAAQWRSMVAQLEQAHMAHGDLDVTNVLVWRASHGILLQLIDYDSMYVPALSGRALTEFGHEHFQPVELEMRRFNAEMDRFSSLVIYLSLMALASDPSMWDACDAEETSRLLLGVADFAKPEISANFNRLLRLRVPEVSKCLAALRTSIDQRQMPPALEEVLAGPDPSMSRPLEPPQQVVARRPVAPIGTGGPIIPNQNMLGTTPQLGVFQPQAGAGRAAPPSRPIATRPPIYAGQVKRRSNGGTVFVVVLLIFIALVALFALLNASAQPSSGGTSTFYPLIVALSSWWQ